MPFVECTYTHIPPLTSCKQDVWCELGSAARWNQCTWRCTPFPFSEHLWSPLCGWVCLAQLHTAIHSAIPPRTQCRRSWAGTAVINKNDQGNEPPSTLKSSLPSGSLALSAPTVGSTLWTGQTLSPRPSSSWACGGAARKHCILLTQIKSLRFFYFRTWVGRGKANFAEFRTTFASNLLRM